MEIKCVKKEKIEYPKMNEISNKKIEGSIPNKWLKFGITSCLLNILLKTKAFAMIDIDEMIAIDEIVVDGATPRALPWYVTGFKIVSLILALTFVISAIIIIIKKIKAKKQGINIKINKKIKVLLIVSAILLFLMGVGYLIYDSLANNSYFIRLCISKIKLLFATFGSLLFNIFTSFIF